MSEDRGQMTDDCSVTPTPFDGSAILPFGRLLSRENRRHGKKMSFYFLFMPRIAVGSNALVGRSRYAAEKKLK